MTWPSLLCRPVTGCTESALNGISESAPNVYLSHCCIVLKRCMYVMLLRHVCFVTAKCRA
jgi:hypothetical protein